MLTAVPWLTKLRYSRSTQYANVYNDDLQELSKQDNYNCDQQTEEHLTVNRWSNTKHAVLFC